MSNNNYGSYHSDSDFSDFEDSEKRPVAEKKAAPTLMDVLCSDGQNPDLCLSPRHSSGFLSFNEASTSSNLAFSDQKSGLSETKALSSEGS